MNVIMLSVAIVTDVVFNLLLIPVWGINGAAFATGLGNFVCGLTFLIWFSAKFRIRITEMIIPQKKDMDYIRNLFKPKAGKKKVSEDAK